MARRIHSNKRDKGAGNLLNEIDIIFASLRPGILKQVDIDLPNIEVVWDDEGLSAPQVAQINSSLAQLGITP